MKYLFRLLVLLSLVVLPLLGTTAAMAQATGFHTGDGSSVVDLTYELPTTVAPFCFDFWRSADQAVDGTDVLLSQYCISDPGLLGPGLHTLLLTLGTDIELVSDATEVPDDYYLIANGPVIYDYVFEGVYQYPAGPTAQQSVFVHGTAADDLIIVNADGSVTFQGSSGPYADVVDFRIRSHGGADSVNLIGLNWGANALVQLGSGDDIVKPGQYQEDLYGGNGVDLLDLRHGPAALMIDFPAAFASWGYGSVIHFWDIENAYGSPYNDYIYGDDGNNWIDGQGGNDDINGGGGRDTLRGGAGYDSMWGGAGNDTLSVGPDGGHAYGDAGFDTLNGSDVNDILVGGEDGDRLWPGLGSDTLIGELGRDTIDYFHPTATGGVTVNLRDLYAIDQGGSNDWIQGVEDILGTPYNDNLTGNSSPNFIFGRDGDDYLNGLSGKDVLWGGLGADWLNGEARDDTLYGNDDTCADDLAVDTLQGFGGWDTAYGFANFDVFMSIESPIYCNPQ